MSQEQEDSIAQMCQQLTQGLTALTSDDPFSGVPTQAGTRSHALTHQASLPTPFHNHAVLTRQHTTPAAQSKFGLDDACFLSEQHLLVYYTVIENKSGDLVQVETINFIKIRLKRNEDSELNHLFFRLVIQHFFFFTLSTLICC